MKRIPCAVLTAALVLGLGACGSGTAPAATPSSTPTPEPVESSGPQYEEFKADVEKMFLDYSAGYSEGEAAIVYEYDINGEKVSVIVTGSDDAIQNIRQNYLYYSQTWESIVSSLANVSSGIVDMGASRGVEVECELSYVKTDDPETVYLSVLNGDVTYNMADELPESKIALYEAGIYKVGAELPADEYYVFPAERGGDLYVCVTSDSNGDDIIDNSFQEGPHYITVEDGQYFEVTRGYFAPASSFGSYLTSTISTPGMYLVGKDIVPGEYKLTATDRGYWCIYNTSSAYRDIVQNDNFDNSAYVTVAEGQYLFLSRCTGQLVG